MAWLISSDSHVIEPPDLWAGQGGQLADRMPRVASFDDGDWWIVDGYKTLSFLGTQTGLRFKGDPDVLQTSATYAEVRPDVWDPHHYVEENGRDGVWGSVLYPSQGLALYAVPVTDAVTEAMRIYNDWLCDFCGAEPARLKGIAMLNVDDVDEAVHELVRCRDKGLSGALIPVAPARWQPYRSRVYDPLWAAAQDLDMPLSLHRATERADPQVGAAAFRLDSKDVPPSAFVVAETSVRRALADLIFSGVFERFPGVKIGSVEYELGWIPFFLDRLDYAYTDRPRRGPDWHRYTDPDVLPSDFFRANVFASFQEDRQGLRLYDLLGPDTAVWGSDYPHTESTFPRSQAIVASVLSELSDEDARRVSVLTCARLYGFDVP